jgi:hypothetical protein
MENFPDERGNFTAIPGRTIILLLVGFFVGRAVMGWAVYANAFFFLILARVNDGKPAGEQALDWGAPVWLTALFPAAAACATTPGHEK